MNINIGKDIRLSDFIDSKDGRSLLLDTTITSSLGATPGMEDLAKTIRTLNTLFDGIILNPGQAEHLAELLGGKDRAAPLVRVDWTNAYRDENFPLPVSRVKRTMISDGGDALRLGASAVVSSFLMGFDEDFEAENIKSISLLARECYSLALPVVVDIRPIGEKVTQSNFAGSIKLGVSFMQEAGADALIIPDCDSETCKRIGEWISIPVILRSDEIPTEKKLKAAFEAGLAGILLSEKVLTLPDHVERIKNLKSMIHG